MRRLWSYDRSFAGAAAAPPGRDPATLHAALLTTGASEFVGLGSLEAAERGRGQLTWSAPAESLAGRARARACRRDDARRRRRTLVVLRTPGEQFRCAQVMDLGQMQARQHVAGI